jgi:hypothetical protein
MGDNPELEVVNTVLELIKDGGKLTTSGKVVNLLPKGTTMADFSNWVDPITIFEKYEQLSAIFKSELADFTIYISWQYNGQYIGNFNVSADGTVDVLSSVDISVETLGGYYDDDGVAQLPFNIQVTFHNLTGGTQRVTYKELARGDGGGMCVGVAAA